jgi:hypothetical protein
MAGGGGGYGSDGRLENLLRTGEAAGLAAAQTVLGRGSFAGEVFTGDMWSAPHRGSAFSPVVSLIRDTASFPSARAPTHTTPGASIAVFGNFAGGDIWASPYTSGGGIACSSRGSAFSPMSVLPHATDIAGSPRDGSHCEWHCTSVLTRCVCICTKPRRVRVFVNALSALGGVDNPV